MPVLRLQPLTAEDTEGADRRSARRGRGRAHRERVLQAAAGVPLFVEQLAALDAECRPAAVPSGMRALMAARIDRITGDARTVIETAAIAGRGVRTSRRGEGGANVEEALDSLVRREILRRDTQPAATASSTPSCATPSSTRCRGDGAPSCTSDGRRCSGPGGDRPRARRLPPRVGVARAHVDRAARRAHAGARRSSGRGAGTVGRRSLARKEWHRAVDFLGARRAAGVGEPVRADILPDLIDALVNARDLEAADRLHEEAMRIARDPIDRARADTAWARIHIVRRQDDWPEILTTTADRSIATFEATGDETWLARAYPAVHGGAQRRLGNRDAQGRAGSCRAGERRTCADRGLGRAGWRDELRAHSVFGGSRVHASRDGLGPRARRGVHRGRRHARGGLRPRRPRRGRDRADAHPKRPGLFEALPSVVEQLGETWVLQGMV